MQEVDDVAGSLGGGGVEGEVGAQVYEPACFGGVGASSYDLGTEVLQLAFDVLADELLFVEVLG